MVLPSAWNFSVSSCSSLAMNHTHHVLGPQGHFLVVNLAMSSHGILRCWFNPAVHSSTPLQAFLAPQVPLQFNEALILSLDVVVRGYRGDALRAGTFLFPLPPLLPLPLGACILHGLFPLGKKVSAFILLPRE